MDDQLSVPERLAVNLSSRVVSSFLGEFPYGVLLLDEGGGILHANRAAADMYGREAGEMTGHHFAEFLSHASGEDIIAWFSTMAADRAEVFAGDKQEVVFTRPDGSDATLEISFHAFRSDGRRTIFALLNDISRQVALKDALYRQTITDPLTGLFNRRYFDERLHQEFGRSSRYRRVFSVLILDIDGFKQANDLRGHPFGDEMLLQACEVFRQVLRDEDTVYRYGGDEFAMILPETTKEGAIEVAGRLRETFARSCGGRESRIKLSLSIGIASHPEDGNDEKTLINMADRRMYRSKESGGNIVTAYDFVDAEGYVGALLESLTRLSHLMEMNAEFQSAQGICHSQEIRALGVEIGRHMGLPVERLHLIEQAAMLHDIGIVFVPKDILKKATALSTVEWEQVKRHSLIGEEILGMVSASAGKEHEFLVNLKEIVAQHHEWVDGGGYPHGLKGDDIRLEARILGVTDAYSAMLSPRPHREAMPREQALHELQRMAGRQFDPDVVRVLVEIESGH